MSIEATENQIDTLREFINIGVGQAASILNQLVGKHIVLKVPEIKLVMLEDLQSFLLDSKENHFSSVNLAFKGFFEGTSKLIFSTENASKLVTLFTDDNLESEDLDSIRIGTLTEIGNIVLNSLVGTISNLLKMSLTYTLPSYIEGEIDKILMADLYQTNRYCILARTTFIITELEIVGDFVLVVEIESLERLLKAIENLQLL